MRAEWRSVSTMFGAPFVMITGTVLMPPLCVDSWDTQVQVSLHSVEFCYLSFVIVSYTVIMFLPTDAVAFGNAHFGAGSGSIHIDDVGCIGSETRLIDCPRSSTVYCRHAHSEDAGVRCQGVEKWCNDVAV